MDLSKKNIIAAAAGLCVVALFFWIGIPGNRASDEALSSSLLGTAKISEDSYNISEDGLKVAVIKEGAGREIVFGDLVKIHYVGRLEDGTKFDSSVDRKSPLTFVFGANQVIDGMEEGMKGMIEGEIRRLVIPPEMAYGKVGLVDQEGKKIIPENSTLIIDVQLISIETESN